MMKRAISTALRTTLSSLVTAVFLVTVLLILRSYFPGLLSPQTTEPATSPAPAATTVITSTLSYSDALRTYEGIATQAIGASKSAVKSMQWLISALFVLATAAISATAYLFRIANEASTKAKDAGEKAQSAEEAARSAKEAALTAKESADSAREELGNLLDRYIRLYEQYVELRAKTLSLDVALQSWDRGEIPRDKVMDVAQWRSWRKWTQQKGEAGWYELLQAVDYGDGLTDFMRSIVQIELEKVRARVPGTESQMDEEREEYEKRLLTLLGP